MKCVKCGGEINDNEKFCQHCGTPVQRSGEICSACGAQVVQGAKFCPKCGKPVQTNNGGNSGIRKAGIYTLHDDSADSANYNNVNYGSGSSGSTNYNSTNYNNSSYNNANNTNANYNNLNYNNVNNGSSYNSNYNNSGYNNAGSSGADANADRSNAGIYTINGNSGGVNSGNAGGQYRQTQQPKSSNVMIPVTIASVIVALAAVVVMVCALTGRNKYEDSDPQNDYVLNSEYETERTTAEKAALASRPPETTTRHTETTTRRTETTTRYTEPTTIYTEPTTSAPAQPSMSDVSTSIQNLIINFYESAWVNTTNQHNPSYVGQYTIPNSNAFNMLGLQYWQERPNVVFDRIYNANVLKIQQKTDGSYDVYVHYTYELHDTQSGRVSSTIELAVDNVVYSGGTFLLSDHTWKKNLPLGTTVTLDYY